MIERAEEFGTKVYYGDGLRIDLLAPPGAETAEVIVFCNDNEGGETDPRSASKAVLEAFPQAAVMVRALRPAAADRVRRARPRLCPARAVRKRGRDGPGGAQAAAFRRREVERVEREYRTRDCERLERQSATGDLHAGLDRAFGADRPLPTKRSRDPGLGACRLRQMLFERLDDRFDHVAVRAVAALHVDVGLGVGRAPFFAKPLERALGIAVRSSGARVAPRRALGQHVDRRIEPDGDRPLVEQLAGARVDEGAAAGGDDPHLAVDQPRDQPALAVAEILLAEALEHFGRRSSPTASSIAESLSTKASPSRLASRRPTVDLPAPISPTSTTGRSRRFAQFRHLKGYTAAFQVGKSPRDHTSQAEAMPRIAVLIIVLVLIVGGLCSSCRPLPKEQPTRTIEVEVPSRPGGNAH